MILESFLLDHVCNTFSSYSLFKDGFAINMRSLCRLHSRADNTHLLLQVVTVYSCRFSDKECWSADRLRSQIRVHVFKLTP